MPHQIGGEHRTVRVRQMPRRPGHAHFERIGVRSGLQHVRVVVAFQHRRLAATQLLRRLARHKAQIGCKAEAAALMVEHIADTVGRVVRRGERRDIDVPHPEGVAAVELVQAVGAGQVLFCERLCRAA